MPLRIYAHAFTYISSTLYVYIFTPASAQSQPRECAVSSPRVRGLSPASARSHPSECAVFFPIFIFPAPIYPSFHQNFT